MRQGGDTANLYFGGVLKSETHLGEGKNGMEQYLDLRTATQALKCVGGTPAVLLPSRPSSQQADFFYHFSARASFPDT